MQKLSKAQQQVVDYLKAGWELGVRGMSGRAWLQQNGIGKGGPTQDVRITTFYILYKTGIIEVKKEGYPISTYKLKESV